jgi:hypothetical protein
MFVSYYSYYLIHYFRCTKTCKVEEKLHLGVREQKSLSTTALESVVQAPVGFLSSYRLLIYVPHLDSREASLLKEI